VFVFVSNISGRTPKISSFVSFLHLCKQASPPSFPVKHAKIVESIGCFDEKSWLIGEDVSKRKLGGEACLQRCKNETNDDILGVLPVFSPMRPGCL
jgi:hypothetical protein